MPGGRFSKSDERVKERARRQGRTQCEHREMFSERRFRSRVRTAHGPVEEERGVGQE